MLNFPMLCAVIPISLIAVFGLITGLKQQFVLYPQLIASLGLHNTLALNPTLTTCTNASRARTRTCARASGVSRLYGYATHQTDDQNQRCWNKHSFVSSETAFMAK